MRTIIRKALDRFSQMLFPLCLMLIVMIFALMIAGEATLQTIGLIIAVATLGALVGAVLRALIDTRKHD